MNASKRVLKFSVYSILFMSLLSVHAQKAHPLEGRWDLEMEWMGKTVPSWLEVRNSGHETLIGRFVFAFGSARPVSEIKSTDTGFSFAIPRQWEPKGEDMKFEGSLENGVLKGIMYYTDGTKVNWSGVRAPKISYNENPTWGEPIQLFNGKDLTGWHTDAENQWLVKDGILTSPKSGANLISDQKFMGFKLHTEFRYPEGSNSGIYLRGRYEVQIADHKGLEPSDINFSGVYGFLEPNENAAKAPGEWQTYDITLIGRRVTVVANGKTVINDQNIPGITGGALDSKEGEPGSFMIQGDHGPVEFKSFVVTPIQ
ncbi:3-keto-disaccharide hydrolase [Flagellimonas allohymeniacidonis]|uniref:DUF1080 domain-containing protein n=1 Tax=Flagellimonas allohymeniacidonis TaxID=2517819 RepID=A0A4Q8QE65_9FLAO|nr:DUF1080 domain-containing protein [Allomuricauda hymeniacidonis]TAI48782.1 DUF1080 domain-containing protein [Allomuricauda hymeniacidonis]